MPGQAKILSLGQMLPEVDKALASRFEVYRDDALGLADIVAEHGAEIAAIITRGRVPTTASLIDQLPSLELIANFGVGYNSIDVAAAARRGIVVTNTPDVLNDEVADFTVGLLLATIRRLPQADQHVRRGRWAAGEVYPLSASLRDRHVGIVGMGRIGRAVARRLDGFNIPISYHSRSQRADLRYPYYPDLQELARAADTLIVVLPGGMATRNAIHADILTALGSNGILINVARGSVVDEAALIAALQAGTISGRRP